MTMSRGLFRLVTAAIFSLALVANGGAALADTGAGADNARGPARGSHVHQGPNGEVDVTACPDAADAGAMTCFAHLRTDGSARDANPNRRPATVGTAASVGVNGGYDPSYLQSAYNVASIAATAGASQTVAIVDAYDDPNAESDLASYRSQWGLPPCTTANGCFRKVDQRGGTSYPAADSGWALEISLDVDMVSAICPRCHILLVEADDNTMANLGAAVNRAVALGATQVSNSWGGSEYSGESADSAAYFNHPGVAITVSSGDAGYGRQFPAASQYVVAVGGTTLTQNTNSGTRNGSETAWSGAGSGCSWYEPKPAWQHDSGCARRTIADVSAVADPSTGVWAFDTYQGSGWSILGGTSAAAPIVAALYALAGSPAGTQAQAAAAPYGSASLSDVVSGSNGSCSPAYLCTSMSGYDGPTGLGTPNGVSALALSGGSSGGSTGGTTPTAPSAPTSLTATAGDRSVQLGWSAVSGSSVTYSVYRGTSAASKTLLKSGLTSAGYTDNAVTNGTTYYYAVTATSGGLESARSADASATPTAPASVPGTPQNVAAKPGSTTGVLVTWKPPASNGGSPVTGYQLWRGTKSGGETLYVSVSCTTTSCSYADTATVRNTAYYYQVVAVNAVGPGPTSSQVTAKAR
jgi:hypothetical protein